MDERQHRGLEIAATKRIQRKGGMWVVPSQSSASRYAVSIGEDGQHCTCPDHELRQKPCKHIFAVEFVIRRETVTEETNQGLMTTTTETAAVRVTYSQNWKAYNTAQTTEKDTFKRLLHGLVANVPEPDQRRGRPRLPMADALFCAAYKVYSTFSARRFMTDLRDAASEGLISRVPHFTTVLAVLESEAVTPIIQDLITQSALPLHAVESTFGTDSTGFGTHRFYRHFTAKYGRGDQMSRDYVKLHATVGCKTNIVTACVITDRDRHDGTQLPALLEDTAKHFNVEVAVADKAYAFRKNFETIVGLGATPYIPFKSNHNGNGDCELWNKLFHFYSLHRDQFLAVYHRRSNVETTFSMIKRKFGDTVRAKTETAQHNEALLKVLCHNIVVLVHEMHEQGIAPTFLSEAA